jgi:uncharacterized protein (DUF1330 family)
MRAYVIVQESVHDLKTFDEYRKDVVATLAPFHGRFLVRGGKVTMLEGDKMPERTVLLEFPSRAQAEGWYHSAAYQKILPLRLKSSSSHFFICDGTD